MGGPIIAGATLARMFTMHVLILPAVILALTGLHLLLVYRLGISEWPMPGRLVRRETYLNNYRATLDREGEQLVPTGLRKDLIFAALIVLGLIVTAAIIGPKVRMEHRILDYSDSPASRFLLPVDGGAYGIAASLAGHSLRAHRTANPVTGLVRATIDFSDGHRHILRRPLSMVIAIIVLAVLITTTWLGTYDPWSPDMKAWSATPIPIAYLKGRTPLELQGAILIQAKQCRNCHSLGGTGGMRGPKLDTTATRLTRNELIRQILQGGGNMPGYGKALRPAEVDAIVAFLMTMHPTNEPPARSSARPAETGS